MNVDPENEVWLSPVDQRRPIHLLTGSLTKPASAPRKCPLCATRVDVEKKTGSSVPSAQAVSRGPSSLSEVDWSSPSAQEQIHGAPSSAWFRFQLCTAQFVQILPSMFCTSWLDMGLTFTWFDREIVPVLHGGDCVAGGGHLLLVFTLRIVCIGQDILRIILFRLVYSHPCRVVLRKCSVALWYFFCSNVGPQAFPVMVPRKFFE